MKFAVQILTSSGIWVTARNYRTLFFARQNARIWREVGWRARVVEL